MQETWVSSSAKPALNIHAVLKLRKYHLLIQRNKLLPTVNIKILPFVLLTSCVTLGSVA